MPKETPERRISVKVNEPVVLEKLFGPMIFADLRITANFERCVWIIERHNHTTGEWTKEAEIDGQRETDFDDFVRETTGGDSESRGDG